MNRLTPIAVVFAALAVLVVWREATRGGSARSLSEEADLRPLATEPFVAADVEKVEVTAPGGGSPAFTLANEGGAWRVLGAFRAPASGAEVKKLIDALAKAEGELRTDDRAALEQFDLTPERSVRVKALGKDGKVLLDVAVGRSSGSQGAFVRDLTRDDDRAYVLAANVRGLLGLSRSAVGDARPDAPEADHFHEKEFPQLSLAKAKTVEIDQPGRRLLFEKRKKDEKDAAGEWALAEGGAGDPMKKEGVEGVLRSLGGGFRPMSLVDPGKRAEVGLETPAFRVAVTGEDGVTRAAVGATGPDGSKYYVRLDAKQDPDVLYEASEWEFHNLFPRGSDLFELPKVDLPGGGPTRVVVERQGHERVEMTRKGTKPADDWTLESPKWPLEARQSSMRSLGSQFTGLRFTDLVDPPQAETPPETVVRLGAPGLPDDQMQVLAVHGEAPWGKDRIVTWSGAPKRWFVVADNVVERLAPAALSFFETKVLHGWRKDDVQDASIEPGFALARKDDGWAFRGDDAPTAADAKAVGEWLDKVLGLEVAGIGANQAPPPPEGAATLTLSRGNGDPARIVLGPAKDGRRDASVGDGFHCSVNDAAGLVPERKSLEAAPAPEKK